MLMVGGCALFLVFLVGWPWFLVEGDHPTRDSFIFVGIGLGMWTVIALLVKAETFPGGQPIELVLTPEAVRWRTLRGGWSERPTTDLHGAAVETTIIYVKGQPGHRYPLRMRFLDGTVLEVGDQRARQFATSPQHLEMVVIRTCLDPSTRSPTDLAESGRAVDAAEAAEAAGDTVGAVGHFRRAIARYPDRYRSSLHRHAGDLLRQVDDDGGAIGHYRSHLNVFPDDAVAWQALAEALPDHYRTELRDETIAIAEQLLLSGRAASPDVARPA